MNHQAGQFRPLCSPGFICLVLGLATLAVYFPVCSFGFVDFDDSGYFFANPHILTGLTWSNIQWAFTSGEDANWHPLTWISLMLDETIFGAGAGGPHVVNVLLHAANSILLFLLFLQMTGAIWRCAGMAVFFAIHPLHVESVAWISERKDVLSAFFGLLALMCYVRCVNLIRERPAGANNAPSTSAENEQKSFRRGCPVLFYILSLFFFACGLMSKPMLVTLPCVMLLLDFWPLQRLGARVSVSAIGRIVIEKIPFFLLTAATSAVTYVIQRNGMAVVPLSVIPMGARIENAFVSYGRYIGKTFCPTGLAAIYPYPGYWPGFMVFLSVVLFVGLSIVALAGWRRFPWFLTGWCWFVGMLVPVIGLVQVGEQAMADRYAYLPMVGVLVIVIWGAGAFCLAWRPPRPLLLGVSVLLFTACAWRARNQVLTWKDDGSLFGHALAVTKDNYMAELNMGFWYSKNGDFKLALRYYDDARKMAPDEPTALYNVGNAFARLGDWPEAIRNYQRALHFQPNQPDVMINLGFALAQNKEIDQAIPLFQAVLKMRPDFANAHNNLGSVLFIEGNYLAAARQFYAAAEDAPYEPRFAVNLGDTLVRLGKKADAAKCYQQALELEPDNQAVQARLKALGPNIDTNRP